MTSHEFRDRLARRALRANVQVADAVFDPLEAYFRLLARWNAKINLTALPLRNPSDETFDRLLVEPLAAAHHVPESAQSWIDLGTGGGSPAIPIKIVHPALPLMMVEARARKTAFLREAIRALSLERTTAEATRFEDLAVNPEAMGSADLLTLRAVRLDANLFKIAARLLRDGGRLFHFAQTDLYLDWKPSPMEHGGEFSRPETVVLTKVPNRSTLLVSYRRVPRGTVTAET